MFDYDLATNSIVALKAYFEAFASTPIDIAPQSDAVHMAKIETSQRIFHEISHLFGFDEQQATAFSKEIIDLLDRSFVSCSYHYPQGVSGKFMILNTFYGLGFSWPPMNNQGHEEFLNTGLNNGRLPDISFAEKVEMTDFEIENHRWTWSRYEENVTSIAYEQGDFHYSGYYGSDKVTCTYE